MSVRVLGGSRPDLESDSAVTLPAPGTLADFDSWFDQQLPCARGNVRCPQPATWRGVLCCGHSGVLCHTHKEECEQTAAGNPHWRWFCHRCPNHSASVTWVEL